MKRKCWHLKERPEGSGNARGILQIFFLSGLDHWDPAPGQQMEVVQSGLLSGTGLWVKGLGAVPGEQPCFLPACNQDGRQVSEKAGPHREKRSPNRPGVSRNDHSLRKEWLCWIGVWPLMIFSQSFASSLISSDSSTFAVSSIWRWRVSQHSLCHIGSS